MPEGSIDSMETAETAKTDVRLGSVAASEESRGIRGRPWTCFWMLCASRSGWFFKTVRGNDCCNPGPVRCLKGKSPVSRCRRAGKTGSHRTCPKEEIRSHINEPLDGKASRQAERSLGAGPGYTLVSRKGKRSRSR